MCESYLIRKTDGYVCPCNLKKRKTDSNSNSIESNNKKFKFDDVPQSFNYTQNNHKKQKV